VFLARCWSRSAFKRLALVCFFFARTHARAGNLEVSAAEGTRTAGPSAMHWALRGGPCSTVGTVALPAWWTARAADLENISTGSSSESRIMSVLQNGHCLPTAPLGSPPAPLHFLPPPPPFTVAARPPLLPLGSLPLPAANNMAGARFIAPSGADRDNKDALRACASAVASSLPSAHAPIVGDAAVGSAPPPYNFGGPAYYPQDAGSCALPSPAAEALSAAESSAAALAVLMEEEETLVPAESHVAGEWPVNVAGAAVGRISPGPNVHLTVQQVARAAVAAPPAVEDKRAGVKQRAVLQKPSRRPAAGIPRRPAPRRRTKLVAPSLSSVPGLGCGTAASGRSAAGKQTESARDGAPVAASSAHRGAGASQGAPDAVRLAASTAAVSPLRSLGVAAKASSAKGAESHVVVARSVAAHAESDLMDTDGAMEGLLALSGGAGKAWAGASGSCDEPCMRGQSVGALAKHVRQMTLSGEKTKSLPENETDKKAAGVAVAVGVSAELVTAKRFKGSHTGKPLRWSAGRQPTCDEQAALLAAAAVPKAPPSSPVESLPPTVQTSIDVAAKLTKKRIDGMVIMVRVRSKLTPLFKKIIGSATSTFDVLPSPSKKQQIIIDTIMGLTGKTAPEALEWLSEKVFRPAKSQNDGTAKKRKRADAGEANVTINHSVNLVRASGPLNQILSHVVAHFKGVVFNTWCSVVVKVPAKQLQAETAGGWKENFLFSQSTIGRQGIIAGVAKGFKYLGAGHRVRPAVALGGEELTDMCLGHFSLGALVVHEALVNIHAGVPHGSSGPDVYRYQSWVNMVIAHDGFLPKDNAADRGLIVVDGADPLRAVFDAEFMPLPADDDMGLATDSEVSGVAGLPEHHGAAAADVPDAAASEAPDAGAVAAPVPGAVASTMAAPVAAPTAAPAAATAAATAAAVASAAAAAPVAEEVAAPLAAAASAPMSAEVAERVEVPVAAEVAARVAAAAAAPAAGEVAASVAAAAAPLVPEEVAAPMTAAASARMAEEVAARVAVPVAAAVGAPAAAPVAPAVGAPAPPPVTTAAGTPSEAMVGASSMTMVGAPAVAMVGAPVAAVHTAPVANSVARREQAAAILSAAHAQVAALLDGADSEDDGLL